MTEPALQDQGQDQGGDEGQALAIETRAKMYGWTPEDDFKGDPNKWVDAQTFVKRAETELPIALGTIKTLERKLERFEKRFTEVTDTLEQFGKYHQTALERETAKAASEYQRGIEDATAQMRQAAEEGDVDGFDKAKARADTLTAEAAKLTDKPEAKSDDGKPKVDPEINRQWVEDNPWFANNLKMFKYARECGDFLAMNQPALKQKEQLEKIAEMVKEEFPDYFANPNRKKPASVDSGNSDAAPGGNKGKRGYNDLPSEARDLCDSFVRDIKGYTKEKYLAQYNGPWKS